MLSPLLTLALCAAAWAQAPAPASEVADLLTVAEKSRFKATSRHHEVVSLVNALAANSRVVRTGVLGKSYEGRELPLLILADPPISSPAEARRSGKLVAFAFGNIHAGEVCGKEALLMLAREIAMKREHPLLKHLVIVFAPIFNADGNERVSKDNRPGQKGPEEGMGRRHNAQDLDLNRDSIKLESPEMRALVRFLNDWDPAMIIDTHTTNGSHHRFTITYAAPRNPAGDATLIQYVRDRMLPSVGKEVLAKSGYRSFFYGNFNRDRSAWRTYPALPRFGTPYRGLRNRIAILSEAYSYADYKDRVLATSAFVRQCLEHLAENRGEISKLLENARARTLSTGRSPGDQALVAIRSEVAPFEKPVMIPGFVEKQVKGRAVPTSQPHTYQVKHFGKFIPTLQVRRPWAYLLPASSVTVIEKLRQHGIALERTCGEVELDCEVYRIDEIQRSERPLQGHRFTTVEASSRQNTRMIPAGTICVHTAQPLGTLAVYLLEPEADDGLVTWNFFDDALRKGQDFPVLRLPIPVSADKLRLASFSAGVNGAAAD